MLLSSANIWKKSVKAILKARSHWIGIFVDENKILSWQVSSHRLVEIDRSKKFFMCLYTCSDQGCCRKSLKACLVVVLILYSRTAVFECAGQEKKLNNEQKSVLASFDDCLNFEKNNCLIQFPIIKSALVFVENRLFQKQSKSFQSL